MPLHLPQHTQDQLFFDHDLCTDTIDWEYRFKSVLLPRYWNPIPLGIKLHRSYKGRTKRRWSKSFNSLNF